MTKNTETPNLVPYARETTDKHFSNVIWYPYSALVPTTHAQRAVQWLITFAAQFALITGREKMAEEERERAVNECQRLFSTHSATGERADDETVAEIRAELAKGEASGFGLGFAYSSIKELLRRLDANPRSVPPPASTPSNPTKGGRVSAESETDWGDAIDKLGFIGSGGCVPNIDTQREEED